MGRLLQTVAFSKKDKDFIQKLNTPNKIQDYLDSIPFNFEECGETCMSPATVLKGMKAHCIEGALFAATVLWAHEQSPLILNLKVEQSDYDHVVALYKENDRWGAISKTNHNVLRFRDPVYKTIRELAMSYFHEYFLVSSGKKTMTGYSRPVNLKRFGTEWVTSPNDLWDIAEYIFDSRHTSIIPPKNKRLIRDAHIIERTAADIPEWKRAIDIL
jgi:hypothetical protein